MQATDYAKFLLALVFVLGMIGLLAAFARRWGLGLPQQTLRRGQQRRLGISEVASLDPKRRLVLIRRDDVEHLIILGHNGETVVETGIAPIEPAPSEAPPTPTRAFSDMLKRVGSRAPEQAPKDTAPDPKTDREGAK